jgi:hypothetical protein
MLIGFAKGAAPSRVTVPETDPAVDWSTVFPAVGAGAAGCDVDSSFPLPPQPATDAAKAAASVRFKSFVFMCRTFSLTN